MLVVLIATVAALYLALCAALFAKQRSLIYFPTPAPAGDAASRMALQVPGATLVVTHRPLQGEQALIYFGGNAEDVALSLPTLEQAFPGDASFESWRFAGQVHAPTICAYARAGPLTRCLCLATESADPQKGL